MATESTYPYSIREAPDPETNRIAIRVIEQKVEGRPLSNNEVVLGIDFYQHQEGKYYAVWWHGGVMTSEELLTVSEGLIGDLERIGVTSGPNFNRYEFVLFNPDGQGHITVPTTTRPLTLELLPDELRVSAQNYLRLVTPYGTFSFDDTETNLRIAVQRKMLNPYLPEMGVITHLPPNVGFDRFIQRQGYVLPPNVFDAVFRRLDQLMSEDSASTTPEA